MSTTATFIELVNRTCERINETTVSPQDFNNLKSIHATIKNSVRDAVQIILQSTTKWPFLAIEQTIKVSPGTVEYAWPTDFDSVDWNSFIIEVSEHNWRPLKPIQRESWMEYGRATDIANLPKGKGIPYRVFSTHGVGFGISPNPDKDYRLKYRYFRMTPKLTNANDESRIPYQYEHVVIACTLMLMYSFLDNNERAAFWREEYQRYKKDMERTLMGVNLQHFFDGRYPGR